MFFQPCWLKPSSLRGTPNSGGSGGSRGPSAVSTGVREGVEQAGTEEVWRFPNAAWCSAGRRQVKGTEFQWESLRTHFMMLRLLPLTETNWTLGPQSVLCPHPPHLSAATLVSTALSAPFAPSILRALHPHTATARAAHPPPQHGHCNRDRSTLGLHLSAGTGQEGQGPKPQGSGEQRPGCRVGGPASCRMCLPHACFPELTDLPACVLLGAGSSLRCHHFTFLLQELRVLHFLGVHPWKVPTFPDGVACFLRLLPAGLCWDTSPSLWGLAQVGSPLKAAAGCLRCA